MAIQESSVLIQISGLAHGFGPLCVLKDLDMHVAMHECLALFGPSGCGKTTLLRLIAGLESAHAGTISIDDQLVSTPKILVEPRKRHIAMVFQDLVLWPHMSALQNVEFVIPRTVKGRASRYEQARGFLDAVHLQQHHDRRPGELSGGEQQRVAIARALAQDPRILLLDEPFSSLDADLKRIMLDLISEIHSSRNLATIYVTHVAEDVYDLADRVALMREGRIDETIPVEVFMNRNGGRK